MSRLKDKHPFLCIINVHRVVYRWKGMFLPVAGNESSNNKHDIRCKRKEKKEWKNFPSTSKIKSHDRAKTPSHATIGKISRFFRVEARNGNEDIGSHRGRVWPGPVQSITRLSVPTRTSKKKEEKTRRNRKKNKNLKLPSPYPSPQYSGGH